MELIAEVHFETAGSNEKVWARLFSSLDDFGKRRLNETV